MEFTLKIKLGNAGMEAGDQVAAVMEKIAVSLYDLEADGEEMAGASGTAFDVNGNKVGEWKISK